MPSSDTLRLFFATFTSIFVAELGDKTSLATLALAGGADTWSRRFVIFLGAALALVATSALGVAAGGVIGKWISPATLRKIGAVLFVGMGIWMWFGKGE